MRFRLLTKKDDSGRQEVKVFDTFVSHYTEFPGGDQTTRVEFESPEAKEECIKMYLNAGFEEVPM